MNNLNNLIFENAQIIYPNFSGREGRYNRQGDRNFSVVVPDPEQAMELKEQGWNIKERTNEDGPTGVYYISGVRINFNFYLKPVIVYVSNGNEIVLTEELLDGEIAAQLDGRGAERYDISIRPRTWDRGDGTVGIKGYVDEMRIVAKRSLFSQGIPTEE